MRTIKQGKQYFDSISSQWDAVRSKMFSDSIRNRLLELVSVEKTHIIADIGIGTGYLSEILSPHVKTIIGIDYSKKMLQEAVEKLRILPINGDITLLPVKTGSMDRVFGNMILHHAPDPADAVKEMSSIIKPGGFLAVSDMFSHSYEFLREEQHDLWLGFEKDEIENWFSKAGLIDVKVHRVEDTCGSRSEKSGQEVEIDLFIAIGKVSE